MHCPKSIPSLESYIASKVIIMNFICLKSLSYVRFFETLWTVALLQGIFPTQGLNL